VRACPGRIALLVRPMIAALGYNRREREGETAGEGERERERERERECVRERGEGGLAGEARNYGA